MRETEGYVPVGEYKVWYRRVGGERATVPPLLLLHGGPGVPSEYLRGLEDLASAEREVIFYDQLGCGKSDQPDDTRLWVVPRFVEEVAQVRAGLGLDRCHILGHSWGGMLAIEYMLTQPQGVVGLILADTTSSMPMFVAEANRLRELLPPGVNATLTRHEADGTTDTQEYTDAVQVFYDRHLCRVAWPDYLKNAMSQVGTVYLTMNGPSEFHVTGTIKDWDRTDRLGEIHAPTLVLSGQYDEATPPINVILHKGIAGARWTLLDDCSHLGYIEQPQTYRETVLDFLADVERTAKD